MRAFRMIEWGRRPELVEVEIPRPGPGEVLVRVAGNGLCHSDITMMRIPAEIGASLGWRMPFTLGHEVGGWVEEVGAGVEDLAPGHAVAVVSPHSCGECRACRRGLDSACERGGAGRGYGADGGLAEFVLVGSARELVRLHALDPKHAGPLTDAGATSHHAVDRVLPRLEPGSWAVVIGAGGLSAFAIQLLRVLSPASVLAVDPNPARRAIARDLGAHEVLDGLDAAAARIAEATGGGADAVLDFVGTDDTITTGLPIVRAGGAFALVGAGGGTFRGPWFGGLPREADVFTFQGSTIADAHAVIALAEAGMIRSDIDEYPLDRAADAYEALEAGTLRGRAVVAP
jgi:propanol-preferring alcohol dehydrogenase